jgi:hypothetical protein
MRRVTCQRVTAAAVSALEAAVGRPPGAPHTLLNLPQARNATSAFVTDVLKP